MYYFLVCWFVSFWLYLGGRRCGVIHIPSFHFHLLHSIASGVFLVAPSDNFIISHSKSLLAQPIPLLCIRRKFSRDCIYGRPLWYVCSRGPFPPVPLHQPFPLLSPPPPNPYPASILAFQPAACPVGCE
ncbi:uncharacterized protein BDR25DRAFT_31352 [Lindgomyces ingoldianus]|uniref:Uncharacterized protein n=1 Tax=Lindgomyces ingoldianus TaxID=673940 RepID=A0ACB6QVL8_9PLEO|nr:uncharacterized protein BDR25DRAFT_31352 [Lindgomyces ingoldianus]KAF2470618.1 hypothetical protein BDR25DRAFT_31352 [Lindgomyces ingoldianus]